MKSTFIQQLIIAAENNANKTAIVDHGGKRQTTYSEFLTLARKTAAYIQSRGIAPQTFIGIKMPYCMEFMAAEVGAWLSRCVAVPMGDNYPSTRIDYIMRHCESPILITIDMIDEISGMAPIEGIVPERDDNALTLYTSGSTGNPKGALITYDALDNNVPRRLVPDLPMQDVVYGISAPLYFALGNNIWDVLHAGGTAHMYSDEVKNNISLMEDYILEHDINISHVSPAALTIFRNKSPMLKTVITAGEKLSTQCSKDGYTLYNLYGQTEALLSILAFKMPDHPIEPAPIGKCQHNTQFMVADADGNSVAQGVTGELCVKGHFFKEYYKEPEMTAQAYRGGWLHTKDLVYVNPDGDIVYVNRNDWMVKVNGQRVEPGEVESAIRKIDGVTGAVVKGFDNGQGSQYLCAFYTTSADLEGETIRQTLTQRLPSYMVPSFYVKMDKFPLKANGKIDRKNMQAPDTATLTEEYVAPSNDVEATLCNAFAAAIGLERIGVNDDFFKLGGNSIQIMKIQQFCIDQDYDTFSAISTKIIHKGRTPKDIALLLSQTEKHIKQQLDDYPLSDIQQAYYGLCKAAEGLPVFNVPHLIKLDNEVDMPRLAAAIETVADAHPGLKTRLLINQTGEVRQKCDTEKLNLQIEYMSDQEFEAEKKNLVQPFFYLKERLSRFRLICTDSAKYFFNDIHHMITDGTSMSIMLNDIEKAYQGQPIEAEDWNSFEMAADEQDTLNAESKTKIEQWAHNLYHDISLAKIPNAGPDATNRLKITKFNLTTLPSEADQFCNKHGITINVLTSAAFAVMIGRYAGLQDVTYTTQYNSREDVRVRNTTGLFAHPLFVRSRWTDGQSAKDFLTDMRTIILECMDNSAGSNKILQQYFPNAELYCFIYQGELIANPLINGKPTTNIQISKAEAFSPIAVHMYLDRANNTLAVDMHYKQDYFSAEFIERMVANYQAALTGLMQEIAPAEISIDVLPQDFLGKAE